MSISDVGVPQPGHGTVETPLLHLADESGLLSISRRTLRSRLNARFVIGISMVLVVLIVAIVVPFVGLASYQTMDTLQMMTPPFQSGAHLLGTDDFGRDLLSRIIYGARVSVEVSLGAVAVALLVGSTSGLVGAYYRGVADTLIMRIMDTLLAFPPILAAIILVGILGQGEKSVVLGVGIVYTPVFARVARAKALSVSQLLFVDAARALGQSGPRILWRHILPNSLAPILVQVTVAAAFAVEAEAGLSFLGLGVQPPTPSWGSILQESRTYIQTSPWFALVPAVALALYVFGITLTGDGLRDMLDPRR